MSHSYEGGRLKVPMVVSVDGQTRKVRTAVRRTNLTDIMINHNLMKKYLDSQDKKSKSKKICRAHSPDSESTCTCPPYSPELSRKVVIPSRTTTEKTRLSKSIEIADKIQSPIISENSSKSQTHNSFPVSKTVKKVRKGESKSTTLPPPSPPTTPPPTQVSLERLKDRAERFSSKSILIRPPTTRPKINKFTETQKLALEFVTSTLLAQRRADILDKEISNIQQRSLTHPLISKDCDPGQQHTNAVMAKAGEEKEEEYIPIKIEPASPPSSSSSDDPMTYDPMSNYIVSTTSNSNNPPPVVVPVIKQEVEEEDPEEKLLGHELQLHEEQVKELQTNLMSLIHSILLTPRDESITSKLEPLLTHFDLYHVAYSGQKDCLRLEGYFHLSFLKHQESFDGQCDLRRVFQSLHTHDKFQVFKRTASLSQFELLWERVKISIPAKVISSKKGQNGKEVKSQDQPVVIQPLGHCLEGTVLGSDGKIWTLSGGRWSTSQQNEGQMSKLHSWFIGFLHSNWNTKTPNSVNDDMMTLKEQEWRQHLKCRQGQIILNDSENESERLASLFFPNKGHRTLYDFMEIKENGEISIYFICPNFSRATPKVAHRIRVCAWKISVIEPMLGGPKDPVTSTSSFQQFYKREVQMGNEYFVKVFKDYDTFTEKLKNASLIYLHVTKTKIEGREKKAGCVRNFEKEKQTLISMIRQKHIRDWIVWEAPPGMTNMNEEQKELWAANEKFYEKYSAAIFSELQSQNFVSFKRDAEGPGGEITAKGLFVQRDQFRMREGLLRVARENEEEEEEDKVKVVEDTVLKLLRLYQTKFPVSSSKLELRQAEMYVRSLDEYGCQLKLRVDEVNDLV